jgi:hypothetical protein
MLLFIILDARVTEIYDEYLDAYGDEPPLPDDSRRVQAWASKTSPGAPQGPSRAVSQRVGGGGGGGYGESASLITSLYYFEETILTTIVCDAT